MLFDNIQRSVLSIVTNNGGIGCEDQLDAHAAMLREYAAGGHGTDTEGQPVEIAGRSHLHTHTHTHTHTPEHKCRNAERARETHTQKTENRKMNFFHLIDHPVFFNAAFLIGLSVATRQPCIPWLQQMQRFQTNVSRVAERTHRIRDASPRHRVSSFRRQRQTHLPASDASQGRELSRQHRGQRDSERRRSSSVQ